MAPSLRRALCGHLYVAPRPQGRRKAQCSCCEVRARIECHRFECSECRASLPATRVGSGPQKKYCSDQCRWRASERIKRLDGRRTDSLTTARRQREEARMVGAMCPICERQFTPTHTRAQKFCSPECRKRSPKSVAARRASNQRHKAAKRLVPAELIRLADVGDRDAWSCGICQELVDRNLLYPDLFSPSLDHIEPLSLGGHHVLSNVQVAHLICNIRRGNRALEEVG